MHERMSCKYEIKVIVNVIIAEVDDFSDFSDERIIDIKDNKREYMENTASIFAKYPYVNVVFDDIYVLQHPAEQDIYGVILRQVWGQANFNNDGWLFFAIEFASDTEMMFHVSTWQPYMLNGKIFPREEVFQLGNFGF